MVAGLKEELEEQFISDCSCMTTYNLAQKYGRSESRIKEWRIGLWHEEKLLWWPGIMLSESRDYDEWLDLEGDAVVIGDVEIPYHDAQMLGYAVSIGKKFKIKQLIVAGDFVANDALSWHPSEDEQEVYSVADELMEGEEILRELFEHFTSISMIKGNHEARGNKRKELGFFKQMQNQWGDLGDLNISYYKWCRLGDIRIEHPIYGKVPGSVARERAEIEDLNIMAGHSHHFSWSFTKSGKHFAIDLGHCTDPQKRYYKAVDGVERYPRWISGFWMVRKGYVYPFPKLWTDWHWWLVEMKIKGD